MKIYNNLKEIADVCKPTTLAIGTFDGVHKGHVQLLKKAYQISRQDDSNLAVFTFKTIPKYKDNDDEVKLILAEKAKNEVFEELGVDILVNTKFTNEVKTIDKIDFINNLVEKLNLKTIVIGEDFKFGYKAGGNSKWLSQHKSDFGIEVEIVPFCLASGVKISSSEIRKLLDAGDVDNANQLLGRNYYLEGIVVSGQKIGRTIGFRTANIIVDKSLRIVKRGVYVSKTLLNGVYYKSVTNVGVKPTVDGKTLTIETHLLDFMEDIYGEFIKVEFLKQIRPEIKFSTREELSEQISADVAFAKEYFVNKL